MREILKNLGLKANEIKQRLNNGQIKLNNDVIKIDIDIEVSEIIDAGDFIFNMIENGKTSVKIFNIIPIEDFFGSNIDNELNRNFQFLRISKKEFFIIKK